MSHFYDLADDFLFLFSAKFNLTDDFYSSFHIFYDEFYVQRGTTSSTNPIPMGVQSEFEIALIIF